MGDFFSFSQEACSFFSVSRAVIVVLLYGESHVEFESSQSQSFPLFRQQVLVLSDVTEPNSGHAKAVILMADTHDLDCECDGQVILTSAFVLSQWELGKTF